MESSEEFSDTDQLLEESQQTLPTPISGSDPLEHNEAGEVKFEEMSISDVVSFLRRNNIPSEFCGKFRENYIDGTEFMSLNEDDMRSIVLPLGLARKILRLQNKVVCHSTASSSNTPPQSSRIPEEISNTPSYSPPSSLGSTPSRSSSSEIVIPDHWRPEIEQCISEKNISDSARNEIVRILVSILFFKFSKPTTSQCADVARKFILKYPFAKDDLGNGYQSWADKMVERVRNVIKHDRKKGVKRPLEETNTSDQPAKWKPKSSELLRRYPLSSTTSPSTSISDPESLAKHETAMKTELSKSKPRDTVLLPLMKSTYHSRRIFILNEATSVASILAKYPVFSCSAAAIHQELGLVVTDSDVKGNFLNRWSSKYVPAILSYGEKSTKKSITKNNSERFRQNR